MYQIILSAVILGICTYTDIRSKRIYKSVMILYLIFSLTEKFAAYLSGKDVLMSELVTGLVPGGVCLLISFLTRQGIGYGDSILIALCGLAIGGMECFSMTLTAFFWAGIWGFVMWRFFHMDRKKEMPFVPFLMLVFLIQNAANLMGS